MQAGRAWRRSIEVLDEAHERPRTVALFPAEVTPHGLPLACEVLPGNTAGNTRACSSLGKTRGPAAGQAPPTGR